MLNQFSLRAHDSLKIEYLISDKFYQYTKGLEQKRESIDILDK